MWLINTRTLTLKEFLGLRPEYAILSHTWGKDEVLFQDMINGSFRNKLGFQKVEMTCKIALQLGHKWAWIDSCCIDKSSSAELSEAINSMYRWYEHSEICFAYLGDLPATTAWENIEQKLTPCRWFKRGWTLQEVSDCVPGATP